MTRFEVLEVRVKINAPIVRTKISFFFISFIAAYCLLYFVILVVLVWFLSMHNFITSPKKAKQSE